jgi:hypothetical protein
MRISSIVSALVAISSLVGCQLIIGWDPAELICTEDNPTCTACIEAADCSGTIPTCHVWACASGRCEITAAQKGSPCSGGYCTTTPDVRCAQCLEDSQCPQDSYCGGGECGRCDDGIQNGDERRPDCGGHCKACLGDPCTNGDVCLSTFCVDGICCDSACDGLCYSCNLYGSCEYVEKYGEDYSPQCLGASLCNGGGVCRLRDGEVCSASIECVSTKCENHICVP